MSASSGRQSGMAHGGAVSIRREYRPSSDTQLGCGRDGLAMLAFVLRRRICSRAMCSRCAAVPPAHRRRRRYVHRSGCGRWCSTSRPRRSCAGCRWWQELFFLGRACSCATPTATVCTSSRGSGTRRPDAFVEAIAELALVDSPLRGAALLRSRRSVSRELHAWLDAALPRSRRSRRATRGRAPQVGHRLAAPAVRRRLRGLHWPKEYGGRGASPTEQLIFYEETARAARAVRRRELRRHAARGPDAHRGGHRRAEGRAPARRSCAATRCGARASPSRARAPTSRRCAPAPMRDGDDYVLNGQKIWCSFGQIADVGEFLVRTDPDAPKHRGISWLILPMDLPGIEVRPLKTVLGSSEFCEVFLTDVRVPVAQPRRRRERRLARHQRHAEVRARHRVRERARRLDAAVRRPRAAACTIAGASPRARPVHRRVRRAVGAHEAQRLAGGARHGRAGRDGDEARVLRGAPALRRAVPARARPRRAARRRQRARRGAAAHARAHDRGRRVADPAQHHRRAGARPARGSRGEHGPRPLRRPGRAARRHRRRCSRAAFAIGPRARRLRPRDVRRARRRGRVLAARRRLLVGRLRRRVRAARPVLRARARSCASLLLGDGRIAGIVGRAPTDGIDDRGSSTSTCSTCSSWLVDDDRGTSTRATLDGEPLAVAARSAHAGRARRDAARRATAVDVDAARAGAAAARCSPPRSSSGSPTGCTELAVAYAKERVQFDRPIGSFQAIKHMLADMLVRTEVARAAVYAAGAHLDEPDRAADIDRAARHGAKVAGRRGRDRERQGRDAGVRRHGLHVGGRRAPLPEAGVGARHPLRLAPTRNAELACVPPATPDLARFLTLLSGPMTRPQTTVLEALARAPRVRSRRPVSRLRQRDGGSVQYTAREMDARVDPARARARGARASVTATGSRRCSRTAPSRSSAFFAALKLGAVQVPINTAYKGEFLRHQLADSGAKVFVVQGDFASRAVEVVGAETTPELDALHHRRSARRGHRRRARDHVGRRARARRRRRRSTTSHVRPGDLACFIYTAGTTGPSKGCMLPHNYIVEPRRPDRARVAAPRRRRRAHAAAAVPLQRDLGRASSARCSTGGQRGDRAPLLGEQLLARDQAHRRDDGVDARLARDPHRQRRRPSRPARPPAPAVRGGADAARHRPRVAGAVRVQDVQRAATASPRRRSISMLDAGEPNKPGAAGKPNRHEFDVRIVDDDDVEVAVGEVGEIVCRPDGPEPDVRGLLEPARRDGRGDAQPLVPHRRPRPARRRRLPLLRRPQEGRAAPAGREHLELRDGEDVVRPRGDPRRRGARGAERARRGRREGHGRAAGRRASSPRRSSAAGWPSGCRTSRSRATSSSATTCPATRSAGCSSTSSATKA